MDELDGFSEKSEDMAWLLEQQYIKEEWINEKVRANPSVNGNEVFENKHKALAKGRVGKY